MHFFRAPCSICPEVCENFHLSAGEQVHTVTEVKVMRELTVIQKLSLISSSLSVCHQY